MLCWPASRRRTRPTRRPGCRPRSARCRSVPESGRLLFALVAPNPGCEVLEIGASRGYSTIWLAAAARILGGRVVSLEQDPVKCEAWRRNIADAGLEEHAELVEGDALATLPGLEDGFDVVLLDAWKHDYEALFVARPHEGRPWRRDRGRQRRLPCRRPCRVRGGAAVRPGARLRHRARRPRPRGDDGAAMRSPVARLDPARERPSGLGIEPGGHDKCVAAAKRTPLACASPPGGGWHPRERMPTLAGKEQFGKPHFPSAARAGRVGIPRKGGGPVVTDSCSTGSGGTSG